MMISCRLLAVDIDGTLVDRRDELTPETREALRRAGRSGIHVVLATGRRYSRSLHLLEALGYDVPLVTASGALVKDPRDHRTLYRARFDKALLCRAMALIARCGYDPVLCADTYGQGFDFYRGRAEVENVELREYFERNPGDGRVRPDLMTDPPPDVFSGFSMGTRDEMLELERSVDDALPGGLSTSVLQSPMYSGYIYEFRPAGVTKWSAIHRLAEGWGVGDEAICAVGDDVNDVEMIRAAGLGVAMGNAVPDVKRAADRICRDQADDGLAEVVEWLLGDYD